jgi:small subunit ribosomal protein S1
MDETIAVRVIEFNKDAKRILVSHTDIWKEAERAQNSEQQADTRRKSANTNKYVEKMNKGAERSTLGELDVLANLKAQMEASPSKKAATKKETPKKEAAPKKEAEVVAPAVEEEAVVEPTADAPASDLASMTVAQLKAAAKDKGITGYTTLKKAELIEVLSK